MISITAISVKSEHLFGNTGRMILFRRKKFEDEIIDVLNGLDD